MSNAEENGPGSLDDHEEPTPTDSNPGASPVSTALRNIAVALVAVASDCGENARAVDVLEGDELRHLLVGVAAKLGELGDLAHEARRIVRDIASAGR